MKNIFSLLALALAMAAQTTNAQTFTTEKVANGDTSIVNGTGVLTVYNKIKATGSPVKLKWNVLDYSTNLGATGTPWTLDGICDNVLCYVGSPLLAGNSYTTDFYNSSAFQTFYALLNADNAAANSSAWVRVRVRDTTLGGTDKVLTFIGRRSTTGITTSAALEGLQLYPNPAASSLFITLPEHSGITDCIVTGADGKTVAAHKLTNKVTELNIGSLSAGHYFLQLRGDGGSVIATRRFIRE